MSQTQLSLFGKTFLEYSPIGETLSDAFLLHWPEKRRRYSRQGEDGRTLVMCLDPAGQSLGESSMPNISDWPNAASVCSLSDVLETGPILEKYFLSSTACAGILRRAEKRGRTFPEPLKAALEEAAAREQVHDSQDPDVSGDVTHPLGTNQGQEACVLAIHPHCIGRKPQNGPQGKEYLDDGTAYTMDSRGQAQCVSVSLRSRDGAGVAELSGEVACTMAASQGGTDKPHVLVKSAVRRLTPVECARLQGFPDNHTLIVWGKKPPEECPDGPQYNAYGNSMATNVMRKIGEWIDRYVRENAHG